MHRNYQKDHRSQRKNRNPRNSNFEEGRGGYKNYSDKPFGQNFSNEQQRRPRRQYYGGLGYENYQNEHSGGNYDLNERGYGNYPSRQNNPYPNYSGGSINQGSYQQTSYSGRGPKGYKRSDESIKEDVCESLCDNPALDATNIEVDASDGIVTLSGKVPDRSMKRAAEDCAENCRGVEDIRNEIQIEKSSETKSNPSYSKDSSSMMEDKGNKKNKAS